MGGIEALTLDTAVEVADIGSGRYVLAVAGDADAGLLKDALYPLVAHDGGSIVVDLQSVPHVPAPLLGILTGAAHLVRGCGGELVIVTRHPRARWLFDESGLSQVARIERTLNDAIADGHQG